MSRSGLAAFVRARPAISRSRCRSSSRARPSISHGRGRSSSSVMAAIGSRSRASPRFRIEQRWGKATTRPRLPLHGKPSERAIDARACPHRGRHRRLGPGRAPPRRSRVALQVGDGHRGERSRSGSGVLRPARRARRQQHSARVLRRLAAVARLPALRVRHEPCRPGTVRRAARRGSRTLPPARDFMCS